jgi:hypothetical protein
MTENGQKKLFECARYVCLHPGRGEGKFHVIRSIDHPNETEIRKIDT